MQYVEAITWLEKHEYKKKDGTFYKSGENISEAQRFMTDTIGEPIMLTRYFNVFILECFEKHQFL